MSLLANALSILSMVEKKHRLFMVVFMSICAAFYMFELEKANYYRELATDNAFNIVEQSIAGVYSNDEILKAVKGWKQQQLTAQTASLKTICDLQRGELSTLMSDDVIHRVCLVVR